MPKIRDILHRIAKTAKTEAYVPGVKQTEGILIEVNMPTQLKLMPKG
jgi:hypothetical protein